MENQEFVKLESLVGKHLLSGVDEINRQFEHWGSMEDCQCINFVLDGITYTAIEDPDDGYRSTMEGIIKSDDVVSNTFKPIEVIVSYRIKDSDNNECDILDFFDAKNGKQIMEIGTDNSDDYYPSFVANWTPENLSVNG